MHRKGHNTLCFNHPCLHCSASKNRFWPQLDIWLALVLLSNYSFLELAFYTSTTLTSHHHHLFVSSLEVLGLFNHFQPVIKSDGKVKVCKSSSIVVPFREIDLLKRIQKTGPGWLGGTAHWELFGTEAVHFGRRIEKYWSKQGVMRFLFPHGWFRKNFVVMRNGWPNNPWQIFAACWIFFISLLL